jgi:hypothetical protein
VLVGWLKDKSGTFSSGLYLIGGMCAFSGFVVVALARKVERSRLRDMKSSS